jgi:cellulose synthase/poly-beta-1,6-N-acetylglucosamine synthase-like glycosyltransferase
MKKVLSICLVLLILSFSLVMAQTDDSDVDDVKDSVDIGDAGDKLIEGVEGVREKSRSSLENDVQFPENLQFFSKILFGIKGEISLQIFIVLIAVWFLLFFVMVSILRVLPIFKGLIIWPISFIITSLIAFSGAIKAFSEFIFSWGGFFKFLEAWPVLNIILTIIIVLFIFIILRSILKWMRNISRVEQAKSEGVQLGAAKVMWIESLKFWK